MSLTICTGWGPAGFAAYGENFIHTFSEYVAGDVRLLAYVEDTAIDAAPAELIHLRDVPGVLEFIARHKADPTKTGRKELPGWTKAERAARYSMRYDAVKFCRQGFIPAHAASICGTEFLAWFDGDVFWKAPVSAAQITSLLPRNRHIAHLGRPNWSEIGFQLYRLPDALPHLQAFRDYYASDDVFELSEWHSAWVFDRAREKSRVASHSLTHGKGGHVWPTTPLGRFCVHLKGNRKSGGRT